MINPRVVLPFRTVRVLCLFTALAPAWTPGAAADRLSAQTTRTSSFLDPGAEELFRRARTHWRASEGRIRSYEAIRQDRMAADLRTPLRDRNLFHTESAQRIRWANDGTVVIQTLASSASAMGESRGPGDLDGLGRVFDPDGDRIVFGLDLWNEVDEDDGGPSIVHPIAPGSEEHYRYRSGDTLTVTLPDGRRLEVVGLELIPLRRSGRLLSGILWIEPGTGALVRATYRLSTPRDLDVEGPELDDPDDEGLPWWLPGIVRPIQFDLSLVVVEYSNWDLRYWLPRRVRAEGWARAGVFTLPVAFEQSYRILGVDGVDDPAVPGGDAATESAEDVVQRWLADREALGGAEYEVVGADEDDDRSAGGDPDEVGGAGGDEVRTIILAPTDRSLLVRSDLLPAPIWNEDRGFASADDLRTELRSLLDLPLPNRRAGGPVLLWGPQRSDLLRYNRVEGLSIGAGLGWSLPTPMGPVELNATLRTGLGTWVTGGGLDASWEQGRHRWTLSGYSRVDAVDPRARSLGLGNSATALLFGRDDGDYLRATGASLTWRPGRSGRAWYRVVASSEEHRGLPPVSDFAVSSYLGGADDPFRPGLDVAEGREHSLSLTLEPTWGADPSGVLGGVEAMIQVGAGEADWTRGRVLGRLAVPLLRDLRAAVEVEGGRAWGDPSPQRMWFIGGARTVRGYEGASRIGPAFGRGRVEFARGGGAARISLFGDAGWAGPTDAWDPERILVSTGAGISFLDGLLRLDVARAVRPPVGWTVGLHVDWIL